MEYKHFSHPHNLTMFKVKEAHQPYTMSCHACKSLINQMDSNVYTCVQWDCSFFLHEHCGNATRYIHHPSHSPHPLVLIPSPTYCSGSFICNACGKTGSSNAYCCTMCEVDLHVNCAFLPFNITHKSHQHELFLNFGVEGNGDGNGSSKACKVCHEDSGCCNKYWSYCCKEPNCDFRVHTGCGTTEVKLGLYQGGEDPNDDEQAIEEKSSHEHDDGGVFELQRLKMEMEQLNQLHQFQLQMSQQSALSMMSLGSSLANLG